MPPEAEDQRRNIYQRHEGDDKRANKKAERRQMVRVEVGINGRNTGCQGQNRAYYPSLGPGTYLQVQRYGLRRRAFEPSPIPKDEKRQPQQRASVLKHIVERPMGTKFF